MLYILIRYRVEAIGRPDPVQPLVYKRLDFAGAPGFEEDNVLRFVMEVVRHKVVLIGINWTSDWDPPSHSDGV
jgi:hypothetical protein